MRKVLAASAAGLMLAFGLAFTVNSAMAGVVDHYPTAGWQVRDADAEGNRPDAADSEIVNSTTVKLVRGDATIGTSIETTDLNLSVDSIDKLSVDYALSGEATTAAGAVRMFIYNKSDANTNTEAPFAVAIAEGESGTLEIALNGVAKIGTMGLVYDASNASTGTVTFSNLAVDGQKVLFVKPEPPAPPACEAYDYTRNPSPGNLCTDFGTFEGEPSCEDIKYRVTILNPDVDPWKLDQGGAAGIGCEGKPLKFTEPTQSPTATPTGSPTGTPTNSPTASPTTTNPGNGGGVPSETPSESSTAPAGGNGGNDSGGDLALTGSSKSTLFGMLGTGLLLVSVGGVLFIWARRRRDADTVESA